jgi:hypothetical protein
MAFEQNILDEWVLKHLEDLAATGPSGKGRVQLGVAFDAFFLANEMVVPLYEKVRKAGMKVITSHYVLGHFVRTPSKPNLKRLLKRYKMPLFAGRYSRRLRPLGSDILLSHATNLTSSNVEKMNTAKAWISSTPGTELQMGQGTPVCFNVGCTNISYYIGNSGDIVTQMRLGLQSERARRNEKLRLQGKYPRSH